MRIKQHNVPYLGALIDALYTSLPILSIINFLSILTVLYTSVKDYVVEYTPWLTFWMFLAFLVFLTIATMVLVYKFVLPSVWTFRQKQMFRYESELLQEVKELREEIRKLREEA